MVAGKVRVPFLYQDPSFDTRQDVRLVGEVGDVRILDEGEFSDGPVASRVAVVDVDDATGWLRPGARFLGAQPGRRLWDYDVPELYVADPAGLDYADDRFIQVNAFALAMKTIQFFERPDILGRHISWAFGSPQLLIVPRAGRFSNAFYHRESHSLQFGYWQQDSGQGADQPLTIYKALSHDIVAHETTHAILDGIAPDLYHAMTPQALAIHEAIADLGAIFTSLAEWGIRFSFTRMSRRGLNVMDALSKVAEQFGSEVRKEVDADFLRAIRNKRTFDPTETSTDRYGAPNRVDRSSEHDVSQVLSGALYRVFEDYVTGLTDRSTARHWGDAERYLYAARRIARLAFRGLDYMPPGEVTFTDYARAVLAADRSMPSHDWLGAQLMKELSSRHAVARAASLEPGDDIPSRAPGKIRIEGLVRDALQAREYVKFHHDLFRIPKGTSFRVEPVIVATRSSRIRPRKDGDRDVIIRVRWAIEEEHDLGPSNPRRWRVPVGTTLVIDPRTREIRSLLTTGCDPETYVDRDLMLRRWANEGRLTHLAGHGGSRKGAFGRILGSFQTLHLARDW